MNHSRQFRAALSELDEMMEWVRGVMTECGVLPALEKQFELAVEEALVNVIHYAYKDLPGVVEIDYHKENKDLSFIIKDKGFEFNPIANLKPIDRESPLEERKEGGLGIYFIIQMTDSVDYQRHNGWNILTLTKTV